MRPSGWLVAALVLSLWTVTADASRILDAGTPKRYLRITSALVTAAPFTACAWFNVANVTGDHAMFSPGDSAGNSYFSLEASGGQTGDPIRFAARLTTFTSANTTAAFTANTWYHTCGVAVGSADRWVYLDGGNAVQNTGSQIPAGLNATRIGGREKATVDGYVQGEIAEVCVWNIALTAAEVAQVYNGRTCWGIRPGNLISHVPVWGTHDPETDLVPGAGARTWPLVDAPPRGASHPPVRMFSPP